MRGNFKLKQGSSKAMVTPAGCHQQIVLYGQLVLEGIPVRGLVDTGASVSFLAYSTWWQHRATWGGAAPLPPGHMWCQQQAFAHNGVH